MTDPHSITNDLYALLANRNAGSSAQASRQNANSQKSSGANKSNKYNPRQNVQRNIGHVEGTRNGSGQVPMTSGATVVRQSLFGTQRGQSTGPRVQTQHKKRANEVTEFPHRPIATVNRTRDRSLDTYQGNGNARGRGGFRGRSQSVYGHKGSDGSSSRTGDNRALPTHQAQDRKPMSYHRLLKLSTERSSEVIAVLGNSYHGFEERIQSSLSPDFIILIVKVLAKACQNEFQENKGAVLSVACHSNFFNELEQHLFRMPTEKKRERINSMQDFFSNLLNVYETIMTLLPNTASEKLENLFVNTDLAMKGVETYHTISLLEEKSNFSRLHKQLLNMIKERETSDKMKSKDELLHIQRPPDDFREKNVFPSVEDIEDSKPFIRPNLVHGTYHSVEHYLDVQFRLLREDFVGPLRDGISQFRQRSNNSEKKRIENVRIYRKVGFGNPKIVQDQIGIVVNFDPDKKYENLKWEYSKRFMYGSLLCFTKDNFQNILFGTVLEREVKQLREGNITVRLCNDNETQGNIFQGSFTMAESEVYFEPYQLVLKALQDMTEECFPMKRYIISVEREKHIPKYLEEDPDAVYVVDRKRIPVLNVNDWPSEYSLQLDSSQYDAFKAALTEEFVVIQGPPGTGKTFIGLKVVTTLLNNSCVWNAAKTPILVVCYTNHALDQFLEGLMGVTEHIVRVGGQSKSDRLSPYNLKEKRRHHSVSNSSFHMKRDLYGTLLDTMREIKAIQVNLEELEAKKDVISVEEFQKAGVISELHLQCFSGSEDKDELINEWLRQGLYEVQSNETHTIETEKSPDEDDHIEDEDEVGVLHRAEQDFLLLETGYVPHSIHYTRAVNKIENTLSEYIVQLEYLASVSPNTYRRQNELQHLQEEYYWLDLEYRYWKTLLQKRHKHDPQDLKRLQSTRNLWELPHEDRWVLYKMWVNELKMSFRIKMHEIEKDYRKIYRRYQEAKQTLDFDIMQNSLVVGMTTTMAARLQPLLQALKSKIVIVEEAAEVLESHIVVSLTQRCEHLILIGDHQQLRPSTSVYKLATQFNFDVSLFERMVKNGIHHYRLGVQHRMRPEIARLIVPSIYQDLQNHSSVETYPKQVKGVTKPLFFITHSNPEQQVEEIMSHQNNYEADFILHLCRYLVQQGYQPDEITVLTTYKGQMFYMKNKQKKMDSVREVRITVVDNFQGEENRIILLSLVRSNEDAKIGFLKIENRVCVALSRAREGLFIIGNMDNLTKSSNIWPKVKASLEEMGCYGTELTLQCQVHEHQLTAVRTAKDFMTLAPEGGCTLQCDALLECGHKCKSMCHTNNRDHKQYKCHEKCERIPPECSLEHMCTKYCYETCGKCVSMVVRTLPCGHEKRLPCHVDHHKYQCRETVQVVLPHCGHSVDKLCFEDVLTFQCPVHCEDRLPCGHSCTLLCHPLDDPDHLEYKCSKPCAKRNVGCMENHLCAKLCHEECGECQFKVKKTLLCNHVHTVECSKNKEEVVCRRNCQKMMTCGHKCPRKCNEACGGCQVMVLKKIQTCGHELRVKCCDTPQHSACRKMCTRKLPCGHDCTNPCGLLCTKECTVIIPSPQRSVCGHSVEVPCSKRGLAPTSEALLAFCGMPCGKVLACGHRCKGSCGECLQGRIHKPCQEKCERLLICGHMCKRPCAEACPPCYAKCQYRCQHSRCPRKCGVPCVPCKERCNWGCEHSRCTKLCHELCDREPCNEPCKKKLKCGHDCIGFCGDPCPPLCRVCNKEEVTDIFFGNEDEDTARFVCLVDCNHTFESDGLNQWLKQTDVEIALKTCPKCKSNIVKTKRFMNYMKLNFIDVLRIKQKAFGQEAYIKREKHKLASSITKEYTTFHFIHGWGDLCSVFDSCLIKLEPVNLNRRNFLSMRDIECLKVEVDILIHLLQSVRKVHDVLKTAAVKQKVMERFHFLGKKVKERHCEISRQEAEDFNRECKRFMRFTQLAAIECSGNIQQALTKIDVKDRYDRATTLINSIEVFSTERDKNAKELLEKLSKDVQTTPLSEEERKEIVRGMNLAQGHWFKCPNGHIYCIGECGGAMVVAKCPECGEAIGGTHHRLLGTNALAPEMDGARRQAWPGGLH